MLPNVPASTSASMNAEQSPQPSSTDRRSRRWIGRGSGLILLGIVALLLGLMPTDPLTHLRAEVGSRLGQPYTVAQRLDEFGAAARARLQPHFDRAGVAWPGRRAALIGIKDQATLELQVMDHAGSWHAVRRYPVLAASGGPGPKLRQGDLQVPEGHYRVTFLNPNSRYHVSLRLDYPNRFDRARAREDGREHLGGDIMIHGSRVSIGCLAMGDPVAEELFTLVADLGMDRVEVLLLPHDFRTVPPPTSPKPGWMSGLYAALEHSLRRFPMMDR